MKSIIAIAVLGFAAMTAQAQVSAQSLQNVPLQDSSGKLTFTLLSSTVKRVVRQDGNETASMQVVFHEGTELVRAVAYVSGCGGTDGAMVFRVDGSDSEPTPWSNKGIQLGDMVAVNVCTALAITQQ